MYDICIYKYITYHIYIYNIKDICTCIYEYVYIYIEREVHTTRLIYVHAIQPFMYTCMYGCMDVKMHTHMCAQGYELPSTLRLLGPSSKAGVV